MHRKRYLVEVGVGIVAMILGIWISLLVIADGYFAGALMLVVTGALSVLLGVKEYRGVSGSGFQESFLRIVRRTMLFLNLMLSLVVLGTLISMLGA